MAEAVLVEQSCKADRVDKGSPCGHCLDLMSGGPLWHSTAAPQLYKNLSGPKRGVCSAS